MERDNSARRLLFDLSAFVQWYSFFSHPIGVPRVTERILKSAPVANNLNVEFIARGPGSKIFYNVPRSIIEDLGKPDKHLTAIIHLRGLYARSMLFASGRHLWRECQIHDLVYVALAFTGLIRLWEVWRARSFSHASALPVQIKRPAQGDAIINLGDFWSQRYLVDALLALKQASGATFVHMMHDLFPIERPDSIHPLFSKIWREQFQKLAPSVDRWLTNSHFVAKNLRRVLDEQRLDVRDITVVPMGADSFESEHKFNDRPDNEILAKFGLGNRKYILHVGTVEARKSITPLLDAIRQLRRLYGLNVPSLVLVGAAGWKSEPIRKRLRETNNEGDTVIWLTKVSDGELSAIYRWAEFVVVPGVLEGWGLPVREALIHGTPCIVSNAGALPEAGEDLVLYFDPSNANDLVSVMERWVKGDGTLGEARETLARRLKSGLSFPKWNDAGAVILDVASQLETGI